MFCPINANPFCTYSHFSLRLRCLHVFITLENIRHLFDFCFQFTFFLHLCLLAVAVIQPINVKLFYTFLLLFLHRQQSQFFGHCRQFYQISKAQCRINAMLNEMQLKFSQFCFCNFRLETNFELWKKMRFVHAYTKSYTTSYCLTVQRFLLTTQRTNTTTTPVACFLFLFAINDISISNSLSTCVEWNWITLNVLKPIQLEMNTDYDSNGGMETPNTFFLLFRFESSNRL